MNNTKNYAMRLRLNRQIEFSDDFRKRFMTREYGSYDKYEKNQISEEIEKGEQDTGLDNFLKNNKDMLRRINTADSEP